MSSSLPLFRHGAFFAALAVALMWLPHSAAAFFCNQPNVDLTWGKHAPFQIDGDGFSRGNFTVIDPGDPSIVGIDKMEITDALEAQFEFTGLNPGTTTVQVRWEFTDKSDNGVCNVDVEVKEHPVTLASAQQIMNNYFVNDLGLDPADAWAFMPSQPFCPGAAFQSFDPEEVNLTLDNVAYFAWLDYGKDLRFGHPGRFYFVDATTGDMQSFDTDWWPMIDGEPYLSDIDERLNSNDLIFGDLPQASSETNTETVSEPVASTTPKEEICAVLVSGTASNPRQIEAFEQDVDFVKKNLMNESLGPQLSEDDIAVMNNASFKEIKDKLESFRGSYSKVYFYYSGHGTERYMVTNDTVGNRMWYVDLANALDATEADDVCVIIDACHSGGAVEVFQNNEGLQSANVTLLTSCAKDTTSWTRYIITGAGDTVRTGEYTWAFVKCFGDPNAESDGVDGISLREAHEWALSQNPTLDVGGTLRGRMDPQIYVHRASRTREREIDHSDVGLTVDQGEDTRFDEDAELRTDVEFNFEDTSSNDDDVYYISPKINWSMNLVPDDGGYSVSIGLKYDFAEEEFTGQGEPGIVYRENEELDWNAYRPTLVDLDNKIVWALEVEKLGQWAIAEVEPVEPNSVGDPITQAGYTLQANAPNPFANSTAIRFTMEQAATVRLSIVDAFGRTLRTFESAMLDAGAHALRWNAKDALGADVPSGIYFCRVEFISGKTPVVLARPMTVLRR